MNLLSNNILDGKVFVAVASGETGEVNKETTFTYHQRGQLIWAIYEGGEIVMGSLMGKVTGAQSFEIVYHHMNQRGNIMTGKCKSSIHRDENKQIRIEESWQWTSGDYSTGTSTLIEVVRS